MSRWCAGFTVEVKRVANDRGITLKLFTPEVFARYADRLGVLLMIGGEKATAKHRLHAVHAEIAVSMMPMFKS
jgi:hypothetical protein